MTARAMSASQLAAELGRKPEWLRAHWQRLVRERRIPKPIAGADGGPLSWNTAQVSAFLDRELPVALRSAAAAYRAALAAAELELVTNHSEELATVEARQRLDARFQKGI
jgi:hypothetical protein